MDIYALHQVKIKVIPNKTNKIQTSIVCIHLLNQCIQTLFNFN
jgi:hypothetical protein